MIRPRASSLLYSLAPCGAALLLLTGCHAQQVTAQFRLGYDEAIRRLYEHHALMNLACAEEGAFFVQMAYSNFGSQIAVTGSISAQFTIIDTIDAPYGRDQVVVDISDQTFAPTLSASQTNVLGLTASPAPNQHAIRELYQAEVNKPPEERFFFMTANPKAVLGAYLCIPYRWHRWIVVPDERKREFADFVYRVSFYDPQASPVTETQTNDAPE